MKENLGFRPGIGPDQRLDRAAYSARQCWGYSTASHAEYLARLTLMN